MKETKEKFYDNCLEVLDKEKDEITLTDFVEIENETDDFSWKKYWTGMPDHGNEKEHKKIFKSLIVHLETEEDFKAFCSVMDQNITSKTKSIYYPNKENEENRLFRWIEDEEFGE